MRVHTTDLHESTAGSRLHAAEAEIARLREALAAARDEQRRSVERTDAFLNILAGELRNPLAPMTHALQILRQRGPHAPEIHWAREVIAHQMQQMDRLIEDLVDLSLMTNGGVELQREEVPLLEIVDRAVGSMRAYLERYNHNLTVTLPPERVILDADPRRLIHVLSHLISNSAKFTNSGGNIRVSATLENTTITICVRDSGMGISRDRLASLFQPFRAIDPTRRSEGGLGVGLSVARYLVELHGGQIEAHSDGAGLGSEFRLVLPIVVPTAQGAAGKGARSRRSRILVVDDNRLAADSLTVLLQEAGNESATAYDGASAISKAEAFRPDVVLLDLSLPGSSSGHDICRQLRNEAWGKDMLILAVTGWGQAAMRDQSAAAGFDDHLVKPVHPEKLMRLIESNQKKQGL